MARGVNPIIRRLLEERRLLKSRLDHEAVEKELKGAEYDLEKAEASFNEGDSKWATVKAYYSMFHAARALLYDAGYRERSHTALITAIRELYVKSGRLVEEALSNYENAMDLREEADYALTFSDEGARRVVQDAKRFITAVKEILKKQS
jgi:uncharacterized protein (UPF0332 family)